MNSKGKTGPAVSALSVVLGLGLVCGCGEYYRPVANPIPQPGGDPKRLAHALVVSSNGSSPGAAVVIDVSGDTNVATFAIGRNPVHATSITGLDYVVNQSDDNVDAFTLLGVGNPPSSITLPAGAGPVFAAPAGGKLFVAEPGLGNQVAVIDISTNSPSAQITVGQNPVALLATPDGTRIYCLNRGDDTVSVIFSATNQNVETISLPAGAAPVWGAVSADGSRVFVVNQGNGTVSVIDATTGLTANTVISTLPVGAGPNYIVYQQSLNRAYVTSPTDKTLSIIDNNTGTAVPPIPVVCNAPSSPTPPATCNSVVQPPNPPLQSQFPISVTALADGSRAYVADRDGNNVFVLNTANNTFIKVIPVGTKPAFIASDSNSTRVYTANSGSFDISLIQTSDDTTVKQSDGIHPLTICAGPTPPVPPLPTPCTAGFTPTFIAMTQ